MKSASLCGRTQRLLCVNVSVADPGRSATGAAGQKRALKKSCQGTACARKDSTLSPVHHFDPRPSHVLWGPWEGFPIQPTAAVSIPAVPGHAQSRNGDGCMPPAIAGAGQGPVALPAIDPLQGLPGRDRPPQSRSRCLAVRLPRPVLRC
jgi:hypothetical protein